MFKIDLTFNQISAPIWPLPVDKAHQNVQRKENMQIIGLSIQANIVAQINDGSVIAVSARTHTQTRQRKFGELKYASFIILTTDPMTFAGT